MGVSCNDASIGLDSRQEEFIFVVRCYWSWGGFGAMFVAYTQNSFSKLIDIKTNYEMKYN